MANLYPVPWARWRRLPLMAVSDIVSTMDSVGHIEASMRTDRGQVREHNEDTIACYEPATPGEQRRHGWLYIVADGVGGAEAGEVASQYASQRTLEHYLTADQVEDPGQRLLQAIQAANTDLRQLVTDQQKDNRMATTMVAAAIQGEAATIANVGDSRAYHWHDGLLRQITKDQSLVARLLEEGAINEEEARHHPRRNVILHSLGPEKTPPIDLYQVTMAPGERLILCSDGLTRHVSDEEMAEIAGDQPPAEATESLIRLANDRGGEDNISVAVLHFGELPALEQVSAGPETDRDNASVRRALGVYTGLLCLVQTLLMIWIWFLIAN